MDKIIEKEFESKQKMPKEMKKDTIRELLRNLFMVSIILTVLSIICFMDEKLIKENFSMGLKIISTILVGISIVFFEIAYRKEKMNSLFWAVEFLILGFILMFVPYLTQYLKKFILGIPVFFGLYYLIKIIIIIIKKRKEFSNKKSDIKEIVKDDKKSYLEEVSKKKFNKNK